MQIEDQSLESNRQPIWVVWGLFSGFSIFIPLFFFVFFELRGNGKIRVVYRRQPKVLLVGLILFSHACRGSVSASQTATDSPCCSPKIRIRPTEMKAEPVRELKYPHLGDAKHFAK